LAGDQAGVHIIDLSNHKLSLVTTASAQDITWSPDGMKLLMLVERSSGVGELTNEVTIADLSSVLTPSH
jgi:hypothetical protein